MVETRTTLITRLRRSSRDLIIMMMTIKMIDNNEIDKKNILRITGTPMQNIAVLDMLRPS